MDIDPISKEIIDDRYSIKLENDCFDVNYLYDWFKFSDNWINPATNIRFRNEHIITFIEKLIQINKIPDILSDEKFKISYYSNQKLYYLIHYNFKTYICNYESFQNKIKIINDKIDIVNVDIKNIEDIISNLLDQYKNKVNTFISENSDIDNNNILDKLFVFDTVFTISKEYEQCINNINKKNKKKFNGILSMHKKLYNKYKKCSIKKRKYNSLLNDKTIYELDM